MKKKLLSLGLIAVLLTGSLTGCGSNKNSVRMINVSYDPTRELFESYNEIFAQHWKEQTGQDVEVYSPTAVQESRHWKFLTVWKLSCDTGIGI